ncbi:hypothetical protein ATCC90586_008263 [Pythium insidiosum]|nr:hypothetical protein ATCC90586_008263 [Pythium insidiosum]
MAASANRNVAAHLARMLGFHVASALFGVVLLLLLALTASGVLLVVLCVVSGSTRTTRVLVASLWRTELRINKLYQGSEPSSLGEQQGYERLSSSTNSTTRSPPSTTTSYHGREVTVSVMIFSILYFIVFKGIFNLIFASIPLALWYFTLCQLAPSIAPTPDVVIGADVMNRLVVGVAFAFAAYQLSDTAAWFLTVVSDKSGGLIFQGGSTASDRGRSATDRTPLLPTDSFSNATYAEYQSMQHDSSSMRVFMEPTPTSSTCSAKGAFGIYGNAADSSVRNQRWYVHVTLEVPTGFTILNGATQGFSWEGSVTNVVYDIECTDGADFGEVLFKASIVVGSEVAVLRSYVSVSSRPLDPADLDAEMLQSKLEVLEKTYHEVPYMSLELKDLVGRGYFGDAYRATYNGQDVVVKTLRASEFGESNDQILKEFQHEAAVLSMFGHHPCVVPFVGASTDMRFPLCLITKYLPGGSLEDNLKDADTRARLSIRQRTLMLKDAAAGLLNIHEGGFIHRDVAARNCLVDQNMRVKICDFGLCRRVNAYGGSLMKDSVGPIKYMAPESLQPPHSFSYNSDSWMFGVLMYETYTATAPFHTMTPIEAMMRVVRGERLPIPDNVSEDLQSLMESCFHDLPELPPLPLLGETRGRIVDFAQIYQHTNDDDTFDSLQDLAEELDGITAAHQSAREDRVANGDDAKARVVCAPDQLAMLVTSSEKAGAESTRLRQLGVVVGEGPAGDDSDEMYLKVQQVPWERDILWGIDFEKGGDAADQGKDFVEETENPGDASRHDRRDTNDLKTTTASNRPPRPAAPRRKTPAADTPWVPSTNPDEFDMTRPRQYRWEIEAPQGTSSHPVKNPHTSASRGKSDLPCPLNKELESDSWVNAIGWNSTQDMPESKLVLDDNDAALIFCNPAMEDARPTLRIPARKLGSREIRMEHLDKQLREKLQRIDSVKTNIDLGEDMAEGRHGTDGTGKKNKDSRVVNNIGVVHHSLPAIKLSLTKPELPKAKLREFHRPRGKFKINERMSFVPAPVVALPPTEESAVVTQIKKSSDLNPTAGGKLVLLEYTEQNPPVLPNPGMASRLLHYWRPPKDDDDGPPGKKKVKKPRPKAPEMPMGQAKRRKQLQDELKQLQKTEEQNKGYQEMLEKGEDSCPLYMADGEESKKGKKSSEEVEKITLNLGELREGLRKHQAEKKRKRMLEVKEQAELYKRPYAKAAVKQSRSRMPVAHLNGNLEIVINKLLGMEESELFRNPVDATTWKHYYDIIKQPIDLSSIKSKIQETKYDSMRDFIKDLELMVNNSRQFNGEPNVSPITANAVKVLKRAQEELASMHAEGGLPPTSS